MRKTFITLLALAMLAAAGLAQAPAKKQAIAILPLDARGVSPDEALTLSDRLRAELTTTGAFSVMERKEMERILKEQAFQLTGACSEASCIRQVGQLIAVTKMVGGSVSKVRDLYTVEARMIDVETGAIEKNITEDYSGPIEILLTQIMGKVARKLAGVEAEAKPIFGGNSDLYLKSSPSGAVIYIDDQPTGQTTPATVRGLLPGTHTVRVDAGETEKDTTVTFEAKAIKNLDLTLMPKQRKLRIYTTPAEADVYLNGKKVGKTPYTTSLEYDGEIKYVLRKLGFAPEAGAIAIEGPKQYSIEKTLTILANVGQIKIDGYPAGAMAVLDDSLQLGKVPLEPKEIYFGRHRVAITAPGHYPQYVDLTVSKAVVYKLNANLAPKSRVSATVRSLALPGLGQMYSGRKMPGFVYMGASLLATAFAGYSVMAHQGNLEDYDAAVAEYGAAASTADAEAAHAKVQSAYDKAQGSATMAMGTVAAAALCWCWNVADAFLFFPARGAQRSQASLAPPAGGRPGIALTCRW